MAEATTPTLIEIDPRELLVDANSRAVDLTSQKSRDLIASLKMDGQLEPIKAKRTADGQLRVRLGHRRTACAIEAGLGTVQVVVDGEEQTGNEAQIDRLAEQWGENEFREGYTTSEKTALVEQMALFGASNTKIGKRLRLSAPQVKASRAVATSEAAHTALENYDLTLDQAAAIAEFEGDEETIATLVEAAQDGEFDYELRTARREREDDRIQAELTQEISALGVRQIPEPAYMSPVKRLGRLTAADDTKITAKDHTECPGHIAWLAQSHVWVGPDGAVIDEEDESTTPEQLAAADRKYRWGIKYGCDNPAAHDHKVDGRTPSVIVPMTDEDREAAADEAKEKERQQRREVIANNKAWDIATEARREWIQTNIGGCKSLHKGSGLFMAQTMRTHPDILATGAEHVRTIGWLPNDFDTWLPEGISESRAHVVHLLLILASYERHAFRDSWRHTYPSTKTYLKFLDQLGYKLHPIERSTAGLAHEADAPAAGEGTQSTEPDQAA
jgi:ParB family chromosome partitioning protein